MAAYSVNFTNVKQENAFSSFETSTYIDMKEKNRYSIIRDWGWV